jgi:hypothetical protein
MRVTHCAVQFLASAEAAALICRVLALTLFLFIVPEIEVTLPRWNVHCAGRVKPFDFLEPAFHVTFRFTTSWTCLHTF